MASGASVLGSTVAYLTFILVCIIGPGVAIQRVCRVQIERAVVVPAGLAYCAAASYLSLVTDWPWLFSILIVAIDATLLLRSRVRWSFTDGPTLRGAIPAFIVLVGLLAVTQYPANRPGRLGTFLIDPMEKEDTAFHVGVTWELTEDYPPQVPGLSGTKLRYHFATHLVRAAAWRWAGIHPYDALARFDVTLWVLALLLALRAGAWMAVPGAAGVAVLAPWTVLAADLSFVFIGMKGGLRLSEVLGGGFLSQIFFATTAVPALAIAVAALVAIDRSQAGAARAWLGLATALGFAVPFFNVFVGALLVGGLSLAGVLRRPRSRSVCPALACLIAMMSQVLPRAGGAVSITVTPLLPVLVTAVGLHLPSPTGWRLAAWSVPWLMGALGLRVIGVPGAVHAIWRCSSPAVTALGGMAIGGWLVAMLVRISADGQYNEAIQLMQQSGVLLWIFTAAAVVRTYSRNARPWLVVALSATLTLPSTVEFIWRRTYTHPIVVPAEVMRAMVVLERSSEPGDVVLTRGLLYPPAPLVFVGRRVPYTDFFSYLQQYVDRQDVIARERLYQQFFLSDQAEESRAAAAKMGASLVFLSNSEQRRTIPPDVLRVALFEEKGVSVHRVR